MRRPPTARRSGVRPSWSPWRSSSCSCSLPGLAPASDCASMCGGRCTDKSCGHVYFRNQPRVFRYAEYETPADAARLAAEPGLRSDPVEQTPEDPMKAWQIVKEGIDALQLAETAPRDPGHGELRVRVEASSINYRDLMTVKHGAARGVPLPRIQNRSEEHTSD